MNTPKTKEAIVEELLEKRPATTAPNKKCGIVMEDELSEAFSLHEQAVQERVVEVLEELEKANDILRSAYQIAERESEKGCKLTNWDAFKKNVFKRLDRQHDILNNNQAITKIKEGAPDSKEE